MFVMTRVFINAVKPFTKDTEEAMESVYINGVSLSRGLNLEKM